MVHLKTFILPRFQFGNGSRRRLLCAPRAPWLSEFHETAKQQRRKEAKRQKTKTVHSILSALGSQSRFCPCSFACPCKLFIVAQGRWQKRKGRRAKRKRLLLGPRPSPLPKSCRIERRCFVLEWVTFMIEMNKLK